MRLYTTMLLATGLTGTFAAAAGAQVIKPRDPAAGAGRLPAPAKVVATQQPDGKIRVVWNSVDNATRYVLVRSVPPTPQAALTLPNPGDTEYVDTDVKPGSTYYYVVTADNEDRVGGMRKSAPPVTAGGATALRAPVDTGTPAEADTSAQPEVPAATNVVARAYPYMQATVSWDYKPGEARFLLERRVWGRKAGWEQIRTPNGLDTWFCCSASDLHPPEDQSVLYRITAVSNAPPNHKSQPVETNPVPNFKIRTEPPVLRALYLPAGLDLRFPADFTGVPSLLNTRYVSLDSMVAAIRPGGSLLAKKTGQTYVIGTGLTRNGAVQSWIWRITVEPARR